VSNQQVILKAKDCSPFENQNGHSEAIQYFITQNNYNIFNFKEDKQKIEDTEIAYFKSGKWYAGRMIGETVFNFKDVEYKIMIEPRFGMPQLFSMLEEIFNIKFTQSNKKIDHKEDSNFIIKQLISFLWLNVLSKANKHGIPKHTIAKRHKGVSVKGRLNVRKSILPIFLEKQLVSDYTIKNVDRPIASIIWKAYLILKSDYQLAKFTFSPSVKNALEQIATSKISKSLVTENEYSKIKYKEIYQSFKPVVDLSWEIINNKKFDNRNSNSKSITYFLDMAEIWETYLRSILKKRFTKDGWSIKSDRLRAYKGKSFQRTLIPDIIMEKENDVMVWDAKYKRMHFDYFDYDRADFFQIHTYIHYYQQTKNVVAGGLLYPLSIKFSKEIQDKNKSNSLFLEDTSTTSFIVDGIDYTNIEKEVIKYEEQKFLDRIATIEIN